MGLLSYYTALYEVMTIMPPSKEFTTKLVSQDTMIIIPSLHCHKQSSTILRLFHEKLVMPKIVKFYSGHFQTLCKQYIPLSEGKQNSP